MNLAAFYLQDLWGLSALKCFLCTVSISFGLDVTQRACHKTIFYKVCKFAEEMANLLFFTHLQEQFAQEKMGNPSLTLCEPQGNLALHVLNKNFSSLQMSLWLCTQNGSVPKYLLIIRSPHAPPRWQCLKHSSKDLLFQI